MTGIELILEQSRPVISPRQDHRTALANQLRTEISRPLQDVWPVTRSLAILAFSALLLLSCASLLSDSHPRSSVGNQEQEISGLELKHPDRTTHPVTRPRLGIQIGLLRSNYCQVARLVSDSARKLRELE